MDKENNNFWNKNYLKTNFPTTRRLRTEKCVMENLFEPFYKQVQVSETYRLSLYKRVLDNAQFSVNAIININRLPRTRAKQVNT